MSERNASQSVLGRFFDETPIPSDENAKQRFVHAERWLRRADMRTTRQLLREYCRMPTDVQFVALLAIKYYQRRTAVPLLMRELANSEPLVAGAASAEAASLRYQFSNSKATLPHLSVADRSSVDLDERSKLIGATANSQVE